MVSGGSCVSAEAAEGQNRVAQMPLASVPRVLFFANLSAMANRHMRSSVKIIILLYTIITAGQEGVHELKDAEVFHSDTVVDANSKMLLNLHLLDLHVLIDRMWSKLLPSLSRSELLMTSLNSIFTVSHMLVERRLICYDAKSMKLIYLLMLAVLLHERQVVTDLRAFER